MLEHGIFEIVDTENLVPTEHLLCKIDAAVNFNKIYDMVEPLYCADNGRPSVDPVVLFKVLIQHLYGLTSLRRTGEEVSLNVAYRWILGHRLQEEIPHFSTISYNFRQRFTTKTADQIFNWILSEIAKAGYLSPGVVFVDGTHIKANAADDARYTPIYQRMYKARKETIERVFADAKEQHGMRYTRYTGLAQVKKWVKLKFAAMNLKKFANRLWKDTHPSNCFNIISFIFSICAKNPSFA